MLEPLLIGHIIIFALSAIACVAAIPQARKIQHPGTREGFVVFLGSVALWSGGYLGYLLAPTHSGKLAFYILGFVFAFVAVGSWLYFCAAYTGRPPRQAPFRNLILGTFLFFTALKVTNPLHNLYFTTEWVTEPFPHLVIHHELLYWIVLGLSYAAIAVGFFVLMERFYHTGSDSRPLVVLVGLSGLPAVATIIGGQVDWLLPLMYEPPGVALFAVGTLFFYRQRFEGIRLTGESDKPAIFLDQENCIRDYNQAARRLFPALEESFGKPLDTVNPALADHLTKQDVLAIMRDDGTRYYDVSSTPFLAGEVMTGQLVTVIDVTERESYRQRLEEKTDQLEALNRVVRHDIRNDMTVIFGWAKILEDHIDEDGEDALNRVLQKSQHVIQITEVARDFIESLSDDGTAELEEVKLKPLLDAELAAVRDSFPSAQFQVAGELSDVSVQANEMLSSLFRNILENAVRHNDKETPEITVTCEEDPEKVRCRIADNGPGIPDNQKEQIFGKGEKGLDSPGSGIGLYLVYLLTDQFGGDVWIEDNNPNGSVFVVELPIRTPPNKAS
ncbi:histidine kinase N-terminal 7TM domain-containing protein [Halorubrum salsamenti]|uniref:histidine kinase N-terminal 7TM domain-containing protein n=1 Tax=Halorubrum salsamenti TaxID=2583990 RepID=UPI0011A50150|nr:histidine kinase N-terminal 7TM domain-containing protein [Halorubrum salsamenti]